jgi:hypothetical protein
MGEKIIKLETVAGEEMVFDAELSKK